MINRTRSARYFASVSAATMLLSASMAFAADPPSTPSKDSREKMAQAHEKMATCLRSDRAIGDCRSDMMQACRGMGEQVCGMGMMGGKGMRTSPSQEAKKDAVPK